MTRTKFASLFLALALAAGGLSACGVKGDLEPPPAKDSQKDDKSQ